MKFLLSFIVVFSLSLSAVSSELYRGKVTKASGLLYNAKWDSCEIEVLEQAKGYVKAKISLSESEDGAHTSSEVLLNKAGIVPVLEKLFWDIGNTTELRIPGTRLQEITEQFFNFKDDKIDYLLRITQHDGFYLVSGSLKCSAIK